MPFELNQMPANGQGNAKEELNRLLLGGRIASVRKEFVPNGEDFFWAFCIEYLGGTVGVMQRATDATPLGFAVKHGSPATGWEAGEPVLPFFWCDKMTNEARPL